MDNNKMETMTPRQRREYNSGESAYYNGISWEELTGIKSGTHTPEYLQGWKDAEETCKENYLNS